jgi:hypothetical protein
MSVSTNDGFEALCRRVVRRHFLAGWGGLLVFLSLGAFLELLHGFKVGLYLDPPNRLRRELWTLAHAHGTLLALLQIAFAVTLPRHGRWTPTRLRVVSLLLLDAQVLIPVGFFLGGMFPSEGDPWVGVLLVPVGAVLLFAAVAVICWSGWQGALPAEEGKEHT